MTEESARMLFDAIGRGKENRVERPANDKVDRWLRNLVLNARLEGVNIINVGKGYYIPCLERESEHLECREYFAKERSRISKIVQRYNAQLRTYEKETSQQLTFEDFLYD